MQLREDLHHEPSRAVGVHENLTLEFRMIRSDTHELISRKLRILQTQTRFVHLSILEHHGQTMLLPRSHRWAAMQILIVEG